MISEFATKIYISCSKWEVRMIRLLSQMFHVEHRTSTTFRKFLSGLVRRMFHVEHRYHSSISVETSAASLSNSLIFHANVPSTHLH